MRITWDKSSDPYDEITNIIEQWCKKNIWGDFLVTIETCHTGGKPEITTEYLGIDETGHKFIWEYDWWEGEPYVELLGFAPMCEIEIHNIDDMLKMI